MTPEQQAAYVIAQAACAIIEALGMIAAKTDPNPDCTASFNRLMDQYGIHHNAVISFFQGR